MLYSAHHATMDHDTTGAPQGAWQPEGWYASVPLVDASNGPHAEVQSTSAWCGLGPACDGCVEFLTVTDSECTGPGRTLAAARHALPTPQHA